MSIVVLKPGLQTTIQDAGRFGFMHLGVASSGAMDRVSMRLANYLVANPLDAPVIEVSLLGPTLKFTQALTVAVTGAKFELWISNAQGKQQLSADQSIQLSAGDTLHFGQRLEGARAYLAFAAQLDCSRYLSSFSTHILAEFGGVEGRALKVDDVIPLCHCEKRATRKLPVGTNQQYRGKYLLRCTASVEIEEFSQEQQAAFFSQTYVLSSASNRMGLRFEGKPIDVSALLELTSSGLTSGSIQMPPSGLPIISSVDGQTIGGYPRIANVISADLFALGQLVAGDHVSFVMISLAEAHKLLVAQQYVMGNQN